MIRRHVKIRQYCIMDYVYEIVRTDISVEIWFFNIHYGTKLLIFGIDNDTRHRDKYYLDMLNFDDDVKVYYHEVMQYE